MDGTFNGGRETLGVAGSLSSSSPAVTGSGRKKKKNKNQRRFSNDQIRSLESIFQEETKLEPRKKLQLATELGLQPRQVAIWFQNKRARWKSKQLERDVAILRNNYKSLLSQFDVLNKEKDSLVLQLQKLNGVMEGQAENGGMENQSEATTAAAAAAADVKTEAEGKIKPGPKHNCFEDTDTAADRKMAVMSSDEDEENNYLGVKEEEEEEPTAALLSMVQEPVDGSLTSSAENWGSLESPENILDQSGGTSSDQWWDFWS